MASIEAVEALLQGVDEWNSYLSGCGEAEIDLTFAELSGADLRRRRIVRCDLTGALMESVNLDGSVLSRVTLTGANLSLASLVDCAIDECVASSLHIEGATIRSSRISASRFSNFLAKSLRLTDVEISNSAFKGLRLTDAVIKRVRVTQSSVTELIGEHLVVDDCQFVKCQLDSWIVETPDISGSDFSDCVVKTLELKNGRFVDSRLVDCRIRKFHRVSTLVSGLDLSGSSVADTDIRSLGPTTAVLLDAAFVSCRWPDQRGLVSLTGNYSPSPDLLRQPVQDIRGVPPQVRRDAADSQYLVQLLDSAGPLNKALYRAWGATSSYGQSLSRLTLASALLILGHAMVLLGGRHQLFGTHPHPMLLVDAFGEAALAFLGIGDFPRDWFSHAVILSLRLVGFLALGVWITIASNKVSRLGSDG